MADDENKEVSEKEKETSKQEEKDQDTARKTPSKSPTPKSPAPSKPGSAKSVAKPGSAKSGTASNRGGSGKGAKSAKSTSRAASPNKESKETKDVKEAKPEKEEKKKKRRKSKVEEDVPPPVIFDEDELPEGCMPIFLSGQTQEIFNVRTDEDVTTDNPYKLLKTEAIKEDLFNRAAVCDFAPIKAIVNSYPGEDMLVVYDPDYKHGQNFYIALNEEIKEKLLRYFRFGPSMGETEGSEAEEEEEEDEDIVYTYVPPVSKVWVSQGSELEIEEEAVKESRLRKLKMSVQRVRREFGAPCNFSDRNVADAKDGYMECTAYEDKSFDLKKIELDKSIQAIHETVEMASQTDWKYPRNATTQYYSRTFPEKQRIEICESKELAEFMKSVLPRFELAMQQNTIMDVFYNDWMALADDDSTFGSKADNHLKEYQSFTDLMFSKDKTITCIEWHPSIRGVVAVAVAERLSFDERIDNGARVIMTPSLVLIWSFTDPIHPQLILEAPEDIACFKFNPTDPNIIAGGCINGQVVLWDISAHADRLKTQRGANKNKKNLYGLPGFEDDNALETPIVHYCAVSSIENSHRAGISDLQWVPDHFEITRMGVPTESKNNQCSQIMTCAVDHCVNVWDTRAPKAGQTQTEKKKEEIANPIGIPTTFKHLDLSWKPLLKVTLSKSEPGGDHSPTKFSISERQGDRSVLGKDDSKSEKKEPVSTGYNFGKPGSAQRRTLSAINTHFYVGTEDGEIVYVDWMPQKDQDSGKIQTTKPTFYNALHDGPVVTLQRSPFFKDILLLVGGWTFSIWKEGINTGPILTSSSANRRLTGGYWSPTRPAVFFVTKQDGSVDVWDLLDRTHEPSMTQSITPHAITTLYPYQVTNKQHLLAVGDSAGTLHILEIPWSLRQPTPNEMTGVSNYFEREVKRRAYVVARWSFREKEKMELESENKKKAGAPEPQIAPNVTLSEEEQEQRMRMEYNAYIEEEHNFLRSLGLKEDVEEPLPNVD